MKFKVEISNSEDIKKDKSPIHFTMFILTKLDNSLATLYACSANPCVSVIIIP